MSEWDIGPVSSSSPKKGGWHWPLTLLALILVSGLSIGMSFLTRDVPNRPIWMMGLLFMVPAGAMFFAAMLMEFATGAMTEKLSRPTQIKVAIIATALTFLVGCLFDAVYIYGGYFQESG